MVTRPNGQDLVSRTMTALAPTRSESRWNQDAPSLLLTWLTPQPAARSSMQGSFDADGTDCAMTRRDAVCLGEPSQRDCRAGRRREADESQRGTRVRGQQPPGAAHHP
jgi:hypothetical protein